MLGALVGFLPIYLEVFLFSGGREPGFQKLNHFFYRNFFQVDTGHCPWVDDSGIRRNTQHPVLGDCVKPGVLPGFHPAHFPVQETEDHSYKRPLQNSHFRLGHKTLGLHPSSIGKDLNKLMIDRVQRLKDYTDVRRQHLHLPRSGTEQ